MFFLGCCCRRCCSHVLPSTITASGVVEESLLSCSLSNDGTSLFSLHFSLSLGVVEESSLSCSPSNDGMSLFSLHFSLSLFLSMSSCCRRCCCSHVLPSTITASGVVEESSLSCSLSNDGMSLFSLRFSLSLFLSMSSCCRHCCCSCALPSSITVSGVVVDGSFSSKNGDDEPNPKSESSDILIDVR